MLTIDPTQSLLLVIDMQTRLLPAIHQGDQVIRNLEQLIQSARTLGIPVVYTEQNPGGLGATIPALAARKGEAVLEKMTFDAVKTGQLLALAGDRQHWVISGCESHVCVLQTALGLREAGKSVYLVSDATGSRKPHDREAAIARMARHGTEIVTTEMVIFEWLGSAEHPRFRDLLQPLK
ncbi:MAG: isochorismatase family protein [Porticoccus sp.]|uniref:isochorismatase family protein n=1 Tax=Porticoccus sp. TaxID=2024853 RepID=UPI003296A4F4